MKDLKSGKVIRMRKKPRFIDGLKDMIQYIDLSNIIMLEVGCYTGDSTKIFASSGKVKFVYGVDMWEGGYDENDYVSFSNMEVVERIFDERMKQFENFRKIKLDSVEASKLFDDGSLDFVYIDALHSYAGVKKDIVAWKPKIRKGGYIGGHDYINRRKTNRSNRFLGVAKAVNEIFEKADETFQDTSWIVRL